MNILSDDERRLLGLEDSITGEGEIAEFARVAEGRGAATAVSLAAVIASAPFAVPRLDAPSRVGVEVSFSEVRPTVVRVVDAESRPLVVRSKEETAGRFEHDAQDPGTLYVDVADGPIAVGRDDGRGVLLRLAPGGVLVVDFHPPGAAIPELAAIRPPLSKLAKLTDSWTASRISELDAGGSVGHAIALGLAIRLGHEASRATEVMDRMLRGQLPTISASAIGRSWARKISPDQIETVVDLALVSVDRVEHRLDELWERVAPQEGWWVDTFLTTALERDDLECLRIVLAERGEDRRIGASLDAIDAKGRRLATGMPYALSVVDERLYRAGLADPDAWWAAFASPE